MKKLFCLLLVSLCVCFANAQITVPAVDEKPDTDAKYLEGAVQDIDGMPSLVRSFELPVGVTTNEALAIIDLWLTRCVKDERVLHEVRLPSEDEKIAQRITMEITFSKTFISHDWADISYVLSMQVKEGKVVMTMDHISYLFLVDNKKKNHSAAELISDKAALNKKKNKMYPGVKKYRVTTINLMDELFASLQREFNA